MDDDSKSRSKLLNHARNNYGVIYIYNIYRCVDLNNDKKKKKKYRSFSRRVTNPCFPLILSFSLPFYVSRIEYVFNEAGQREGDVFFFIPPFFFHRRFIITFYSNHLENFRFSSSTISVKKKK